MTSLSIQHKILNSDIWNYVYRLEKKRQTQMDEIFKGNSHNLTQNIRSISSRNRQTEVQSLVELVPGK